MQPFRVFILGTLILFLHVLTETAASIEKRNYTASITDIPFDGDALGYRMEEQKAQSLLSETNDVIKATKLHIYQRKTLLSVGFLNTTIPILQGIQSNLGNLLADSEYNSYAAFKEADDVLEAGLTKVTRRMQSIRASTDRYTSVYSGMAGMLSEAHDALGDLLLPVASVTPKAPTVPDTEEKCGGIHRANVGSISYKVGQKLNSSEGCFWIIETTSNNPGYVMLKLKSPGFITTNETFLSIGYFKDAQYHDSSSFHWEKFKPGSDPYDIVVEAKVVFVHFVASPAEDSSDSAPVNQGFELKFQARFDSGSSQSYQYVYKNEFITGPSGTRRYPTSGNYFNNERTALVLQPTVPNSVLTMKRWQFEGSADPLSIWTFGPNLQWSMIRMLTSSGYGMNLKFPLQGPRIDPVLLIFKSDGSQTYDGFEFQWEAQ